MIDATLVHPVGVADPPAGAAHRRRDVPVDRRVLSGVLIVASLVTAWLLLRHPMWFDEMQAWNIARASRSFGGLVGNLRYEGHPVAWYTLLFALTQFTGDPRAMQVLELAIVVATYAVILFRSPFPVLYRVGLVASYFVVFEYGVITRSYGLEVLVLVLLLSELAGRNRRWLVISALSVVLAFTALPGAVLALAVAAAVFCEDRRSRARLAYAATTVVAAGISALTCVPPSDFRTFAQGLGNTSQFGSGPAVRFLSSLAGLWRALVPIPDHAGAWNTNVLDRLTGAVLLQAVAGLALFVVVRRALRFAPTAGRLWWIGCAGFLAFSLIVILPERSRYAGTGFLLLVACAWMAWAGREVRGSALEVSLEVARRPFAIVFGAVLVAQVVAMLAVVPFNAGASFSPDRHLADVLRDRTPGAAIVSGADYDALTAAGYLDQPVYSVARGSWTHYFVHDARQARGTARLKIARVFCTAANMASDTKHRVVAFAITDRAPAGVRLLVAASGVGVFVVAPGLEPGLCP